VGVNEDVGGKSPRFAYLDLLATTLTEHEKSLDKIIKRLENLSRSLSEMSATIESREPAIVERASRGEETQDALIYMKLKTNRPVEELKSILDSLKE
jgi:hypothetical protein